MEPSWQPRSELPNGGKGDDCVLPDGMSSSRSPKQCNDAPLSSTETRDSHCRGHELRSVDEFFSLYEEELGGTRPDRLAGVRPQVRVLPRTVEQIVDTVPVVPLLDDEPQMEEQLVDVLSPYDLQVPEQEIEVPKIIIEDIPSRRSCREPNVDTPVPRRGGVTGQQGSLPRQSSSSFACRGRSGGLHGFLTVLFFCTALVSR